MQNANRVAIVAPRMAKIFTYEQAVELLPAVRQITDDAVAHVEELDENDADGYHRLLMKWVESLTTLGIEVKGLWLVDFDNGSGYYCWRHPEPALEYFHGYEEGFGGRVKLN